MNSVAGVSSLGSLYIVSILPNIWWKTAKTKETFGGKQHFNQKHLVGIELKGIFASKNQEVWKVKI